MINALATYRPGILDAVRSLLKNSEHIRTVNSWGDDLTTRLERFATRGKLIRGSLVCASLEAFGGAVDENAYTVGAVMELLQSFLLVHDDIMDQDAIRRGEPALYEQYRRFGESNSYSASDRFGESMGICAGDVAVLLAFEAVARLKIAAPLVVSLTSFLASEIGDVGVAQMADVVHGHQSSEPGEEQILNVYRFKTGRYTFSVPLILGAMLAGASDADQEALGRWGELQGVIFQLRDDELGLMGDTDEIGKPAGSDITADKKTLHRLLLLERCEQAGIEGVRELFGSGTIAAAGINRIRELLRETGTLAELSNRISELREQAEPILSSVSGLGKEGRAAFASLASYNAGRDR